MRSTDTVARLLAVATAMLIGACGFPGRPASPPPDIITPAKALAVVHDYWKMNEQAAMHQDSKLFAQIETGFLTEVDQASARADLALGRPALAAPGPLRHVTTYVPHQHRYPAEFVALIETVQVDQDSHPTNDPLSLYEHFTQPAARDPWKSDFDAEIDPSHPLKFAQDRDRFTTALPADASQLVLPPSRVAASLATYLDSGVLLGTPTGPFAPGPMTTKSVELQRAHLSYMSNQGYIEATDFTVLPYLHTYRSADGGAIVLFALRPSNKVSTDPTSCIIQPANHQWGGLVPLGTYASVTIDDLLQLVATDPPARSGSKVDVVGVQEDQVAARVVPSPLKHCS